MGQSHYTVSILQGLQAAYCQSLLEERVWNCLECTARWSGDTNPRVAYSHWSTETLFSEGFTPAKGILQENRTGRREAKLSGEDRMHRVSRKT